MAGGSEGQAGLRASLPLQNVHESLFTFSPSLRRPWRYFMSIASDAQSLVPPLLSLKGS